MKTAKMNSRHLGFLAGLIASSALLLAVAAPASAAPAWRIDSLSNPSHRCIDNPVSSECADDPATSFVKENRISYIVQITNVGDRPLPEDPSAPGSEYHLTATFPDGLVPVSVFTGSSELSCDVSPPTVTCAGSSQLGAMHTVNSAQRKIVIGADIEGNAQGQTLTTSFEVSGGGVPADTVLDSTQITGKAPDFGVGEFDGLLSADPAETPFAQAAGHPYELSTAVEFNSVNDETRLGTFGGAPGFGDLYPVEPTKDVFVDLPPGLLGNPTILGQCTVTELGNSSGAIALPLCPPSSQVGSVIVRFNNPSGAAAFGPIPVFNMVPPTGSPARFGFNAFSTIVVMDAKLRSHSDYGVSLVLRNISGGLDVQSSVFDFWGVPGDSAHTPERACPGETGSLPVISCKNDSTAPFLRLPTSCTKPGEGLEWKITAAGWFNPARFDENGFPDLSDPNWKQSSYVSHDAPGYPAAPADWGEPRGPEGCQDVPLDGQLTAQPTALDAETATGLNVHVEVPNPGLENPKGIASSDIKKVKVALPQGMTVNPSQAEGLGVCKPSQYESTVLSFRETPGKGCPDDSKIGTVKVVTPLLQEALEGDVFIAEQDDPATSAPGAENPFDSLLALYVVIKSPERGILIKLPGKVETDGTSGRIVTTFDDLPQLPFDSFDFKFREGARAPLVTPPTCGTYTTEAEFTGHADPDGPPLKSTSSFQITRGIGAAPCPPGGVPSFDPGFSAGSINNNAGSFSPTIMRLTRQDGEQNLTKFSAVLPKGLLAKLAGVEKCSEASIAQAKAKTGRQELSSPSCPADSRIGRTLAGAGVGSVLTHVPGALYLAGPYNGAPLSVVAITPAVAGPFDVGTVLVRVALDLDPVTAVASVDGAASDPIPHILKGIPLKLRDLRVYVNRDQFTLNPTSCNPDAVGATLWGSYADVFSPADDVPVSRASRFQAANCAALPFKPKLNISLKGGTKRGAHPALRAVLTPRSGDANIGKAVVKLPRSAFLDQGHIRTICTRVQWAAKACPPAAAYGKVTAWSPLLDEPLAGPVYLRSSNNKLPDLVFDLKGLVDIEVSGRIDSVKGGIRAIFAGVPDAPVSRLVLEMQGGRKGLIQNSRNICKGKNRADVKMDGQNGAAWDTRPVVRATNCAKRQRRHKSAG